MKRLYIPTSSLNFNNILSSESISPKAFYGLRGFGYKRWTEIPENGIENVILLYKTPFYFVRPKSEEEDHPMLIELATDENFPTIIDGVYSCDHTLYFSPWNVRFIFFNEQTLVTTISLSDHSLETKFVSLYRKRIICFNKLNNLRIALPQIKVKLNSEAVRYDQQINKMKGMLYGYYIGALLSRPLDAVKGHNALQELRNTFSSILSFAGYQPTAVESSKLNALFGQLESMFESSTMLQTESEDIILNEHKVAKISNDLLRNQEEKELAMSLFNRVLNVIHYSGSPNYDKEEILKLTVACAKSIYQHTDASVFNTVGEKLNGIYKYVNDNGGYSSWDDSIFSALAAVVKKGNDWEQLLSFMQSKGMTDYRLPFALYGEYCGLANLTRDFTDNLLALDDKSYVAKVIKEFNGQLLGNDLEVPVLLNEPLPEQNHSEGLKRITISSIEIWQNEIRNFAGEITAKGKDIRKESLENAFKKNGENKDYTSFLSLLQQFDGWKNTSKGKPCAAWKKMQEHFVPACQPLVNRTMKKQEIDLFENEDEQNHVIMDIGNIDKILQVINEVSVLSTKTLEMIKKDLEWILDPKYSKRKSRDELLEELKAKLEEGKTVRLSKTGKDMSWKNEAYKKIDIEKVISVLKSL